MVADVKTPMAQTPITQTVIAKLTGVSQCVVSAVLNNNFTKIRVAPAVRERVRSKAQSLGYRVNTGARAMRTRKYFNIGYFLANIPGTMAEIDFPEFRAGAYDAAVAQDYHVSLIRLPTTASEKVNPIPKAFREAHFRVLDSKEEFYAFFTPANAAKPEIHGGFALAHWNGSPAVEEQIKNDLKVTIRCIPFEDSPEPGTCPFSGEPSKQRVIWAKSY